MKLPILFLASFFTYGLLADSGWTLLKTAQENDIEIKITKSPNTDAPFIVLAPGQSCNSKSNLFEMIEKVAIQNEINIVRFEWGYCSPNSKNRNPSNDLSTEINDMEFVINYSKNLLKKENKDLFISGKSLGSMVAFKVFKNHAEFNSLALLSFVCSYSSDNDGSPLPKPLNVINENYPGIELEKRNLLIISGNNDQLCDHDLLNKFKDSTNAQFELKLVKGNHGFSILNPDGSINQTESEINLHEISNKMFNWFVSAKDFIF